MCRFVFGLREFIRFVGVGCALKTVLLCEPFVRCRHSGVFPASLSRYSGVMTVCGLVCAHGLDPGMGSGGMTGVSGFCRFVGWAK
jgi:hypothetical protein